VESLRGRQGAQGQGRAGSPGEPKGKGLQGRAREPKGKGGQNMLAPLHMSDPSLLHRFQNYPLLNCWDIMLLYMTHEINAVWGSTKSGVQRRRMVSDNKEEFPVTSSAPDLWRMWRPL
jgi:hypothetical protein